MGSRKRLVQVQVDNIDAHVARPRHSHQCVHVRPVHVHQPTGIVHNLTNLTNILLKKSEGIRIGKHQSRYVSACTNLAQVLQIGETFSSRSDRLY